MLFQEMNAVIWLIESMLWWIGSGIAISLGFIFINQMKKNPVSKRFMFGISIFSFTYGIARILENIRHYVLGTMDNRNDIYEAWISSSQISGVGFTLRILYYIIAWFGISTFYFVSEKYVFRGKYKYSLTLSAIIEGIVSVLNYIPSNGPPLITTILAAIGFFIAAIFPIYLYIIMAKTNTGVIRTSCIIVALGITLFVVSVMADLPESLYITTLVGGTPLPVWITSIAAPIMFFSGVSIMAFGFIRMFSKLT
ncbi:MAG: hypothetical protein ACTSRZ_00680 [Promethearchaeota archaeon]